MYLRLNHVRQHSDLEIRLGDSGLHMLQGRSGAGKTTVLDAILEALYGGVQDFVPWGASKANVELEINNPKYLKVVRTRGPASLSVVDAEGKEYKDDVAQALIESVVGMSEHEFLACCYIQQGMFGSLLSLTPNEQLKFIQKLGQTRLLPDEIKTKTTNLISNSNIELVKLTNSLSNYDKQLASNLADLSGIYRPEKPVKPQIDSLEELNGRKSDLLKQRNTNNSKVSELNSKLNNPIYNIARNLEDERKRTGIERLELEKELNKNLEQKQKLEEWLSAAFNGHSEEQIKGKLHNIEVLKRCKLLTDDIADKFGTFRQWEGTPSEFLKQVKTPLISQDRLLRDDGFELRARLVDAKKAQKCPECEAPLCITNGIITSGSSTDRIEDLEAKLAVHAEQIKSVKELLHHVDVFEFAGENLKKEFNTNYSVSLDQELDLINEYNSLQKYKDDRIKLQVELKTVDSNISKLTIKLSHIDLHLSQKEKQVKEFTSSPDYMPFDDISVNINKLHKTNEQINTTIQVIDGQISEQNEYIKELISYENSEKQHQKAEAERKKILEEIDIINKSVEFQKERIAALTKLKELSEFAAVSATEIIIDSINLSAQDYLNKLFSEDGTQIKIKNHKITKAGDERAKLSLDIFHKGKQAKAISSLSGGEKSRACLAFQLALADLYKSNILLIDEGFSGLSDVDKQVCMEILQEVAKNRLVVVIEHGASEAMFDTVINL